jgi:hypothetical protein
MKLSQQQPVLWHLLITLVSSMCLQRPVEINSGIMSIAVLLL